MSKKQKNSAKTKKPWLKYGVLTLLGLVVVGVVAFWGYQNYQDKVDADRFATLQADFKKLQVEFNKIDPGWEYSEGCTAGGLLDDFKTCGVSLSNNKLRQSDIQKAANTYGDIISATDDVRLGSRHQFSHDSKEYIEQLLSRKDMKDANCDLLLQKAITSETLSSSVGCSHPAQSFYFKRSDR